MIGLVQLQVAVAVAVACQSPMHDTHSSDRDLADVSLGWDGKLKLQNNELYIAV